MPEDPRILWPARESMYDLMTHRASIGAAAFGSERQGEPIDPSLCEFSPEWFEGADFWFSEWPTNLVVKVLALDPSKGSDAKKGDFGAYVYLGVDPNLVLWIDAWLKRQDTAAMVAEGIELCRTLQPDAFVVEENAFQHLLKPIFLAAAERAKLMIPLATEANTVPKQVRIRRWTPYLSQRRVRVKRGSQGAALLVKQWQEFPIADHDDGPDSAEMAMRTAIKLWNAKKR